VRASVSLSLSCLEAKDALEDEGARGSEQVEVLLVRLEVKAKGSCSHVILGGGENEGLENKRKSESVEQTCSGEVDVVRYKVDVRYTQQHQCDVPDVNEVDIVTDLGELVVLHTEIQHHFFGIEELVGERNREGEGNDEGEKHESDGDEEVGHHHHNEEEEDSKSQKLRAVAERLEGGKDHAEVRREMPEDIGSRDNTTQGDGSLGGKVERLELASHERVGEDLRHSHLERGDGEGSNEDSHQASDEVACAPRVEHLKGSKKAKQETERSCIYHTVAEKGKGKSVVEKAGGDHSRRVASKEERDEGETNEKVAKVVVVHAGHQRGEGTLKAREDQLGVVGLQCKDGGKS